MASVPSYVLAGILKGRRRASEAALKYAVYGAGAAGVMLYGISLLAGLLGTAHMPTIAAQARGDGHSRDGRRRRRRLADGARPRRPDDHGRPGVQALGRAVPLLVPRRVRRRLGRSRCVPLGRVEGRGDGAAGPRGPRRQRRAADRKTPRRTSHDTVAVQTVAFQQRRRGRFSGRGSSESSAPAAIETPPPTASPSPRSARFIVHLLAIVAAITCTFGNLAAYGQTNIKRLLAYSTIAHAGYMMMAVAAAVQLAGTNAVSAREAVAALVFYLGVYVFMNLGAFAIVAFLRGAIGSEEIADYAGLIRSVPVVAVALVAILVSLIGIPPLAGFIGKFADLRRAGRRRRAGHDVAAGDRRLQHRDLADLLPPRGEDRVDRSGAGNSRPGDARHPAHGVCFDRGDSGAVLRHSARPGILDIAHQATQQLFM